MIHSFRVAVQFTQKEQDVLDTQVYHLNGEDAVAAVNEAKNILTIDYPSADVILSINVNPA